MSRHEVESFNESKCAQRTSIYHFLVTELKNMKQAFIPCKIYPEIHQNFDVFLNMFQDGNVKSDVAINHDEMANANLYYSARIGLELIRLWKQSTFGTIDVGRSITMDRLCDQFKSVSKDPRYNPRSFSDILSGPTFYGDNTTVVLYFDHLLHNTPPDHIERDARVQMSLKLVNGQSKAGILMESVRALELIKCNDILSAPVWCLPLVHSPHYLSHLWNLSEEAKDFDLLVPLEFDTEWESLDESESEPSHESKSVFVRKKNSFGKLKETCPNISTDISSKLDPVDVSNLMKVLQPSIADEVSDCLCDVCIEERLGRQITVGDFKPSIAGADHHIPCNEFYMMNHPNKFRNERT